MSSMTPDEYEERRANLALDLMHPHRRVRREAKKKLEALRQAYTPPAAPTLEDSPHDDT